MHVQMHSTSAKAKNHYPAILIALHWLVFILVVTAYALTELKSFAERGSDLRSAMLRLHYLTGITVFALTWLRLAVRTLGTRPPVAPLPPRWLHAVATLFHIALYAMLIALPLLGWLALTAKAEPIHLFFFDLPFAPIELGPELARPLRAWHARVANAGYALIGLHAGAALFHHYVLRDNALVRMLPVLRPRSTATKNP